MEMLSKAKAGYEGFMSSLSELGALNVSYMEKMAEKQMASSKFVTDLGFEHMKNMMGVDSLEKVKTVPSASLEVGTKLAKKTMEEGKSMMEVGSSYKSDITAILKKKKAA